MNKSSRYGIMFTVKNPTEERKVSVMDFHKGRIMTFHLSEIEGDEMEDDLKEFMAKNIDKVQTGYWDYTGQHKK
jgi:hypothetical protein